MRTRCAAPGQTIAARVIIRSVMLKRDFVSGYVNLDLRTSGSLVSINIAHSYYKFTDHVSQLKYIIICSRNLVLSFYTCIELLHSSCLILTECWRLLGSGLKEAKDGEAQTPVDSVRRKQEQDLPTIGVEEEPSRGNSLTTREALIGPNISQSSY